MDDDLGIPAALAVLHDTVRQGNHAADESASDAFATAAKQVRAMLAVLGLDPLDSQWGKDPGSDDVLEALVENVLALRGKAKSEKDFALSDALRAALDRSGIANPFLPLPSPEVSAPPLSEGLSPPETREQNQLADEARVPFRCDRVERPLNESLACAVLDQLRLQRNGGLTSRRNTAPSRQWGPRPPLR